MQLEVHSDTGQLYLNLKVYQPWEEKHQSGNDGYHWPMGLVGDRSFLLYTFISSYVL